MTSMSTEMIKKICEERGVEYKPQYSATLGYFLEIFDENLAFCLLQKADERLSLNEKTMGKLNTEAAQLNHLLLTRQKELSDLVHRAERAIDAMQAVTSERLDDSRNAETLRLYRMMLKAGVEVFGAERMTDNAIESVCKAASYNTWRSQPEISEQTKEWRRK